MKTKILLFLLSYFTLNECVAQHLEFKSLEVIPSGYAVFTSESLYNLTWDDTKNRYSTGSFSGTFDFDLSLNENILESYGEADLFVKKEDSLGNLLWVRQIGADLSISYGQDIQLDNQGNIYILGYINSGYPNTVFDLDPSQGVFYSPEMYDGYFMLKLSSDGDFLWAKSINGYGINFTLDSQGNSIVTSSPVGIFIIEKLNPTGNTIWSNSYGNGDPIYSSYPGGIVVDSDNSFYISGSFSDTLELDENGIAAPLITGETNYKTFLAKFNSSGEFIWNKSFSGSGMSYSNNLFLTNSNELFLVGSFQNEIDFDLTNGIHLENTSTGSNGMYLVKVDLAGNYIGAKLFQGFDLNSSINSIQFDSQENIYISGNFALNGDFHPGNAVVNHGNGGSFLVKLDPQGNYIWSNAMEGWVSSNYISRIFINEKDELFYTGAVDQERNVSLDTSEIVLVSVIGDEGSSFLAKYKLILDSCSNFRYDIREVKQVECGGQGSISIYGAGGKQPYEYIWEAYPTDSLANILIDSRGLVDVSIKDSNGCLISAVIQMDGPEHYLNSDLKANLVLSPIRTGFTTHLTLNALNDGCLLNSGQIQLIYPSSILEFQTANSLPDEMHGDTLIWNINLQSYDSLFLYSDIEFLVSQTAQIGDSVSFKLIVLPTFPDNDTLNNIKEYVRPIINGYDPNDIQVYPQGKCEERFVDKAEKLTYVIRFQNTGNSEAVNIQVLNQLDLALDLSSLSILGKSFKDMYTEILPNHVLKFHFDSIMLPDSSSQALESQGFIIYEIKPLSTALNNDVVRNQAEIYFDFNPAVITNMVSNTLIDEVPVCFPSTANLAENGKIYGMSVYPNPTTDSWFVNTSFSGNWILFNAIGQKVRSGISNTNLLEIDALQLEKGFYVLKVNSEIQTLIRN